MKDIFRNLSGEVIEPQTIKLEPIGLKPREIWLLERINDISCTILRYKQFDKDIPREWIDELISITNELDGEYPPLN